ncbi:helix-turn-helix domain-containing protein [Rhodococcus jostii]|uniref:helix-turn-helix domain-containing protein n=1 Tax=Rhodococcus jostii TaxID=132919 RepID=UPI00363519FF
MTEMVATQLPRLHKLPAAQERIGIGRSKLFDLIKSGELRSVKIGKTRLISESAIVEFIEKLEA